MHHLRSIAVFRRAGHAIEIAVAVVLVAATLTSSASTLQLTSAAAVPTLTVTPTSAAAGTAVTLSGSGFPGPANVTITLDGSTAGMPTARTKNNGTFSVSATIPANEASGTHTFTATASGVSAIATVQVTTGTGTTATRTATPTSTSGGTVTILFSDGFDSGNTAAWDGTNTSGSASTVNVTSAAAYSDNYGLDTAKIGANDNGTAEVFKGVAAPASSVVSLRTRLRIVSRSGNGMLYFQHLYRQGPVYQPIVGLRHNGTSYMLHLRRLDGSTQEAPLATQLVTGTWYDVELVYNWSGSQPVATAYINGTVAAAITDGTTGTLYPPDSVVVGLHEDYWTQQAEAQWDSVSVANGVQSTASALTVASGATATATATAAATPTAVVATATAAPTSSTSTTSSSTTSTDEWTQDGHDAQHTGSTSEEPTESWSYAWSWNGPDANGGSSNNTYRAPSEARTVVGAGHLYAPAGAAGLYALNLTDGSVAWHLTSPAFNATPAYDPTTATLFAGGADGNLYKLNPANGQILATYNAGAPLNKAVVLASGAAFLTDANSNLHKVSTSTLTRQWLYSSGCSTECAQDTPPAFSASRNVIVFATGDLYVHAVNVTDGSLKWKVKPTPLSPGFPNRFARGWPVIAEQHGLVLLHLQADDNDLFAYPSTGGIFPNSNAAVRSFLQANPSQQTVFALSLDTGSQPFIPAVGYGSVDGTDASGNFYRLMPSQPVVKVWPNGDEVAYIQFRNGQTTPTPPDGRWDGHMGEMVLDSTTVPTLNPGDLRFVQMDRYGTQGGNAYTFISDEQYPLTLAGSSILYNSFTGLSSAAITNRATSYGLSYSSPIPTTAHPPIIKTIAPCGTLNTTSHWANCTGLTLSYDTRYWSGPGFWMYWNVSDPGQNPTTGLWPPAARYGYVTDGLIIYQGEVGDLLVLHHASSPTASSTTSSSTPTPTATPTATSATPAASGPLSVGVLTPNSTNVAQYDKLQLTVPISGSVADNLQFPYDPVGAPGLAPAIGLTVDAELLPPGQSNWAQAIVQPGFLYQDYARQQINGKQWLYPQNTPTWQVRFAPQQQGTWQVRVRAQDASICTTSVNPCTNWVRSTPISFSVTAPRPGNHGSLQVSPTDSRYFQFSDGTPFVGQGFDDSFGGDTYQADAKLATDAANGVTFLRSWMDGQDIAGSSWSPWWAFNAPGYGGYLPEPGLQNAPSGSGHDFVFQLTPSQPCIMDGFTQGPLGVKPSTTYRLTSRVQVSGLAPANAANPSGFAVKTGGWPANNTCPGGVTPTSAPIPETGDTSGFTTLTGTLTTSSSQNFLDNLYLMLNNAGAGQALVTSVALQEVLPGGALGPNLIAKGNSDMHEDFNQTASWTWDHVLDTAAQDGVYLKLVTLEKNDRLWNRINPDGTLGTNDSDNPNFYAAPGTKVRSLQQYYWRYLAARWGYATAVHSWELTNEGDGGSDHAAATDAFAAFTHHTDPSRHMVSTSIWAGFPVDAFWANSQYPNIDYADLHAYVSTGFGTPYAWEAPSGTTLETNPANTYQHSLGAITMGPGLTSNGTDLPIRGQGTWTISVMIKANNIQGACPYGAPASMAGPRLQIAVAGVDTWSIPYDPPQPDHYWICTTPAGTYDYTQFSGTISIPDNNWHTLTLRFQTDFATSGTAWFDNLRITSPDGRTARVLGNGSFDDRGPVRYDYDTGAFNADYGLLDGAHSLSGANKPLVRGETGIDYVGGPQTELPQLANDTHGVWLHNFLWGALNSGGMYDLYWWTQYITNNNLFFQYKPVHDFLSGIPLNNGLYQDAQPTVSSPSTVAAIGQKDLVHGSAFLWIRNLGHTWYNVVNNIAYSPLNTSGSVQVSGFSPNATYSLSLWEFDNPGNLTQTTVQLTTDGFGVLTFNLSTLPSTTTDVALRL